MNAEFTLAGETLAPIGVMKRPNNTAFLRYFEGQSVVACKIAMTDRSGAGLHASAAASKEDTERFRNFVKLFVA